MSITKGTWKVSGDYVIAKQNEEDYVDICRNLAFSDDARLISAAPDLLEVCEFGEMLEEKYFEPQSENEFQAMLGVFNLKVKAAIAKAKKE